MYAGLFIFQLCILMCVTLILLSFFHSYTILCQIKWLQLDFIVCLHD